MDVRFITPEQTWSLRHRVLRPHQTLAECDYAGDRDPRNFHLGTFIEEVLVSIGTFHAEANAMLPATKPYRLRGMATDPELRSRGSGSALVSFGVQHLRSTGGDLLWFHARSGAIGFYRKLGFDLHGDVFNVPGLGEHHLMFKRLDSEV